MQLVGHCVDRLLDLRNLWPEEDWLLLCSYASAQMQEASEKDENVQQNICEGTVQSCSVLVRVYQIIICVKNL